MAELAVYPPNPANVPADLTEPNWAYCSRVTFVLGSLVLFIALYLGLVVGSAYLCYSSFMTLKGSVTTATKNAAKTAKGPKSQYPAQASTANGRQPRVQVPFVHVIIMVLSGLLFLFLLKNFFKFGRSPKFRYVEITEKDQPTFFAFLRRLCKDTGAPMPNRVLVTPDVNASVVYNSNLQSLFLPTPKNLIIGLGLVNGLSLTEFKAVLAHEFGHFSQSSMKLGTYVYQVNRIIADMVYGRDFFDDMLDNLKRGDPRIAVFAGAFAGVLWALRKTLEGLFCMINFANSALSRQMEFNADLVAVSVAGSDAIVHALARLEHADHALNHAMRDLTHAGDHKLYTRDLFHHQTHAVAHLRRQKKDPKFGALPPLPDEPTKTNWIFKREDTGIPLMWATHPSNYDRENNAKSLYLRADLDDRPSWVLFENDADLRAKVSAQFYEITQMVPAERLADAAKVQAFIDAEHAETTYPARFHGMYDDRYLDLAELESWVHTPPEYRDAGYLQERHGLLCGLHVQTLMKEIQENREDLEVLEDLAEGRKALQGSSFAFRGQQYTAFEVGELLVKVKKDLDDLHKRLGAEDRIVFQVHYAMAQQVSDIPALELLARYRFHAGVQEILQKTGPAMAEMHEVLHELSMQRELSEEYFRQVLHFFQELHVTFKTCLDSAARLKIPKLENMEEGQALNEFLLTEALVSYLPDNTTTLTGKWVERLNKQVAEIVDRVRRIHFKSLGGIFLLQDRIVAQWQERNNTLAITDAQRETALI